MAKFYNGTFKPKNPEKYVGVKTKPIIFRSGWEYSMMVLFDTNHNIVSWASESVVVPYINPFDKLIHKYFIDFFVEIRDENHKKFYGAYPKILIEVKPHAQTMVPKKSDQNNIKYTYVINTSKWNSAKAFAQKMNMKFYIITEKNAQSFMNDVRNGKLNGKNSK